MNALTVPSAEPLPFAGMCADDVRCPIPFFKFRSGPDAPCCESCGKPRLSENAPSANDVGVEITVFGWRQNDVASDRQGTLAVRDYLLRLVAACNKTLAGYEQQAADTPTETAAA